MNIDDRINQIEVSVAEILNRNLTSAYQDFSFKETIFQEISKEVKRILTNQPLKDESATNTGNFC